MSDEGMHDAGDLAAVRFRRFAGDDAEVVEADLKRLYQLYRETPEAARDLSAASGLEELREQLRWPGHEPARDRWLASAGELLIGYSSVFKPPTTARADLLVIIHPAARRRGLGAELLRRAQADATALGATDAAIYVNDRDAEAAAFVQRRGFAPVGAFTELAAPGASHFPQAQWPDGFSVRAWRDQSDLATLTTASNRAYAGLWGHNDTTAEEWAQWLPTLDTNGVFFLLDATGGVAGMARGAAQTRDGGLVGVVDAPGVVAEQRSAGLYRPLLLHTLAWLVAQRPPESAEYTQYTIESWGDDPAVLDQYRALGFATQRRETLYRRRLAPLCYTF